MNTCFDQFSHRVIEVNGAAISVWIGGSGEPLLLVHGYPETHMMWWKVAPELAKTYTVICPDTRGYGDSSCPPDGENHYGYSKRAMGEDFFELMKVLGYDTFFLMGHDRGARVCHQMMLDHPERIRRTILLDIISTVDMYERTDMEFARIYYHWFFLIQGNQIPERLIAGAPEMMVKSLMGLGNGGKDAFPDEITAHYVEKFSNPDVIHATCEDYRAGATIDLEHQRAAKEKFRVPTLVLWGAAWLRRQDVLGIWRNRGAHVCGTEVAKGGHFIPEENPEAVLRAVERYFTTDALELTEEELAEIKG